MPTVVPALDAEEREGLNTPYPPLVRNVMLRPMVLTEYGVAVREWRWTLVTVVVTSIGLLAGCTKVVVVGSGSRTSLVTPVNASAIVACRADAKAVEAAAEAYHAQVGGFPTSLDILTRTVVVSGQTDGPWLRAVPSTGHYSIFIDPRTGAAYVYPPGAGQPASYDARHDFDLGDPCASFAA